MGDFVALDSLPIVTDSGFVNARHLDGKAGVAAALGALHALCRDGRPVPHDVHLLVTIAEEVGQGQPRPGRGCGRDGVARQRCVRPATTRSRTG